MATLASVALKCAKQLGRVDKAGTTITDLASEIKEEIGEAIIFYNRQPWALTEVRGMQIVTTANEAWYSTVDLTTGQGEQSLTGRSSISASDILQLHYLRVEDEAIDRISYEMFERYADGSTSLGDPTFYTRYAGQIGFWPTPNTAYTIYMSGSVKPVVPVNDEDTSVWFDQAEEMVVAGAIKRVLLKYVRDEDRASTYVAIERDAMLQFNGEYIRKSSSRRLKVNE